MMKKNTSSINGKIKIMFILSFCLVFSGCGQTSRQLKDELILDNSNMQLTSVDFENEGKMSFQHTCDGKNVSPSLNISTVPENAKSLAIIMDDPDAQSGDWVHWLVWNIDPKIIHINENTLPEKAIEGYTSFNRTGYGGPCPPSGSHRYFFKLYALDVVLDLDNNANKSDLENAMEGHILEKAELMGVYSR